ncbi:MAG: aminotransferase class IV [Thermoleophilaceae bacterium]
MSRRMADQELACLDGRIAAAEETAIPVTDEGFLRGDGVFEVARVYAGAPYALPEHFDRMERSAANLRLEQRVPRAELERETSELLAARGDSFDGCLRYVLTRGGRRLVMTEPLKEPAHDLGVCFVTYAPTRILDGVKSLSYAGNMLATRIACGRGFDEAVLVTPHGRVLEAPTSSIFWAGDDGRLCTTPLADHILASITRQRLMELVEVEERPITADELLGAAEAFLASTTRQVHPIARIEDSRLESPGPRTREAADAFAAHLEEALGRPVAR